MTKKLEEMFDLEDSSNQKSMIEQLEKEQIKT